MPSELQRSQHQGETQVQFTSHITSEHPVHFMAHATFLWLKFDKY